MVIFHSCQRVCYYDSFISIRIFIFIFILQYFVAITSGYINVFI